MKTLSLTTRLAAAAAAIVTTTVLFSSVISISEPQRSVLIAKTQHLDQLQGAPVLAMAPTGAAQAAK